MLRHDHGPFEIAILTILLISAPTRGILPRVSNAIPSLARSLDYPQTAALAA
jgi:hypothetical protein